MKKILSLAAALTILSWTAPVQAIPITPTVPSARTAFAGTSWTGTGGVGQLQGVFSASVAARSSSGPANPSFSDMAATWAFSSQYRSAGVILVSHPILSSTPANGSGASLTNVADGGTSVLLLGGACSGLMLFIKGAGLKKNLSHGSERCAKVA